MSTTFYKGLLHPPQPGQPVIFAFHGTGGDEHQFFSLAQSLLPGGGVVAPRGDVSEMGAARFFRRTGEGVYDMDDLAARTQRMVAFVTAHRAAYQDSPAYGFGYSNGANILAAAVMAQPDLFDRFALLHPLIPWDPDPVDGLRDRKVLITAGQRDPITPLPRSLKLIAWFKAQGAEVDTVIHDGGHDLRAAETDALQTLFRP